MWWRNGKGLAQLSPILVLAGLLGWQVWMASQDRPDRWGLDGESGRSLDKTLVLGGATTQPEIGHGVGGDPELDGDPWTGAPKRVEAEDPSRRPVVHELLPPTFDPLGPRITIRFRLASDTRVRLEIRDPDGGLVRTLVDERRNRGEHRLVWNTLDDRERVVEDGTYYLRLTADGQVRTEELALSR